MADAEPPDDSPLVAPEAEASVLAAMLRDPSCMHRVENLQPRNFTREAYGIIFETAVGLGDALNVDSLMAQLRTDGKLGQVGGHATIVAILEAEPHAARLDANVKLILEASERRADLAQAQALARAAQTGTTAERLAARAAIALGGASTRRTEPPGGWRAPMPLTAAQSLPVFPVNALPLWMARWVEAESEALQVPSDLPALLALGVVSATISKKTKVAITSGWSEPTNLYVVVALPPGEGKSPAFRHATWPLILFEREESKRLAPVIEERTSRSRQLRSKVAKLRTKVADADHDGAREKLEEELREAEHELATLKIPVCPRFCCDDVTMEALAPLMIQQGGKMGIFSSEGGPFAIMAGRYGDGDGAFELFLKAHSGDHVAVDRITRAGGIIHEPILVVLLTVQPSVIAGLAENDGFRGRGVLARLAYALPKSRVGGRAPRPAPMPRPIADAYAAAVRKLLQIPTNYDSSGEIEGHSLDVDEAAADLFFAFKAELEPQMGPGGELEPMADWANKLPGMALRIAGVLHMADNVDDLGLADARSVGAHIMQRAIAIARYLLAHARAAFSLMAADPLIEEARLILAYVQRKGLATVTRRALQRAMQSRFRKARNLDPVIELLTRHGFFWEMASVYNPKGGQPEVRFSVNPMAPDDGKCVTELTEPGHEGGSVSSVTQATSSQDDESRRERMAIEGADGVVNAEGSAA